MNLSQLGTRYIWGNRLRAFLTVLGMALAITIFASLRSFTESFNTLAAAPPPNRLFTTGAVRVAAAIPLRIFPALRGVPGITAAVGTNRNEFDYPAKPDAPAFSGLPVVNAAELTRVFNDMVLPEDQFREFLTDPQGLLARKELAEEMGWSLGDQITLRAVRYGSAGDRFRVRGIFTSPDAIEGTYRAFFYHTEYYQQQRATSASGDVSKRTFGIFVSMIDDPANEGRVAAQVDAMTLSQANRETVTVSERAFREGNLRSKADLFSVVLFLSLLSAGVVMVILGNSISLNINERINDFGALRAIGFRRRHLVSMIGVGAGSLGLAAGLLGVGLAWVMTAGIMAPWMRENLQHETGGASVWPAVELDLKTAIFSILLATAISALASVAPILRASRMNLADALQRTE